MFDGGILINVLGQLQVRINQSHNNINLNLKYKKFSLVYSFKFKLFTRVETLSENEIDNNENFA